MDMSSSPLDSKAFRGALGNFLTGVTVVTTLDSEGRPRGLTANSFTSVSLNPPLILTCIGQRAASFSAFRAARRFAVNILSEDMKSVASIFASRSSEKFEKVAWSEGEEGVPILEDGLAWLECGVHDRVDAGDHLILIGRVLRFRRRAGRPLGYYAGDYVYLESREGTGRAPSRFMVGALIEADGRLLLTRDADGGALRLPAAPLPVGVSACDAARALCREAGIEAELSSAYSLFTAEDGRPMIVFRGAGHEVRGGLSSAARLVPVSALPWGEIEPRCARGLLRRYLSERDAGAFGIFVDDEHGGTGGAPNPWAAGSAKFAPITEGVSE